jgi:iron complex outermembrane recepter protein
MTRLLLVSVSLWATAALADILAPKVIDSPAAVYPAASIEKASVVTLVTVDASGQVTGAEVVESGGAAFDAAALEAVKRWKFQPATRDGAPIPARIRIPFRFEPPPPPPALPDGGLLLPPAAAAVPSGPVVVPLPPKPGQQPPQEESIDEVTVRGTRHQDFGTGDFQIELGALASTVGASAAKALELAPGIVIGNEGGLGHAQQIILRGFNADQGTAVEFNFNGVPINQVSNTDAQGYADLNFLIPEVVREVVVLEGPYDPRQGDFAAAGSANYELGVLERGTRLQLSYGSFNTVRALGVMAPVDERTGTFLAFQYIKTNGYGANRSGTAVSAMGQYEGTLGAKGLWHVMATGYTSQYQMAGAVRQDDVQAGLIPYYGTYDTLLGGNAQTFNLAADIEVPSAGGVFKLMTFVTWRTLKILENFEGIFPLEDNPPQTPPGVVGEGIQQSYTAFTTGSRGSYRMSGEWLGREQALELGYYARYDHATPMVARLIEGTTTPYALENDTTADVVNLAAYADVDFHPVEWFRLRGGFRADYYSYDVLFNCGDLNGAAVPGTSLARVCTSTAPERKSTGVGIFEPRVTALGQLTQSVSLSVSYGVGAQSQDAQYVGVPVAAGQPAPTPFAKQQAVEGGVLYKRRVDTVDITARAVGFYSTLSSDFVFDPDLGFAVPSPGTTRVGAVGSTRATGTWFDVLGSFTYADAFYTDSGQLVPLVPAWVVRLDAAVFGPIPGFRIDGTPVVGKLTGKASFIGSRPIGDGFRSPSTFTLDADASFRWRAFELGVRMENITNLQYALTPFFGPANFPIGNLTTPRNPLNAYTFTAAPPRAIYVTAAVIFGGP